MNLIRFLILLFVFLILNGYLFIRGRQAMPDRLVVHMIYTGAFLFVSLSIFIAIFAGNKLPAWLALVFEQAGGYWMILFVFFLAAALFGDLLRVADFFFHIFPNWVTTNYPLARILYFSAVMVLLGTMSLFGFLRFSHPGVVELNLSAGRDTLPAREITILAVSDMHLGNVVRKGRLVKWVDLINSQKPDVILLVGDIFDHSFRAVELQHMGEDLGRLAAPLGVYAVPGNHDYYTGIDKTLGYLRQYGIRVLRDSVVTPDNRIVIIGRDDLTNKNRKTLASLVSGLNGSLPKIVLDHQPQNLQESVDNHIDLQLSGHTHNGQIFPFDRIVSKIYKLGYGYLKIRDTHFYVSSGLGLWGAPLRIGTQSEIVKIRLKTGTD
jgi:uncharacterized protein